MNLQMIYVDDIIFESSNKSLWNQFADLIQRELEISII